MKSSLNFQRSFLTINHPRSFKILEYAKNDKNSTQYTYDLIRATERYESLNAEKLIGRDRTTRATTC